MEWPLANLFDKAIEVANRNPDVKSRDNSLLNISKALSKKGSFDKGIKVANKFFLWSDRGFALCTISKTLAQGGNTEKAIEVALTITLTFGYQSDMPPVIQDILIAIHPGECVALVGPSGCEKTTIVRLLLGFDYPQQGSIYYDNQDLKGLNLQALRSQMGVVFPIGAIFDGTILDNINIIG